MPCMPITMNPSDSGAIMLYEGQYTDHGHATFNAAFLVAISCAYPDRTVVFRAHPNHISEVRKCLSQAGVVENQHLEWQPYIAKRGSRVGIAGISLPAIFSVFDLVRASAQLRPSLIVAQTPTHDFMWLYKLISTYWHLPPTMLIQHGELGIDLGKRHGNPAYTSLTRRNHSRIGNVVLGRSILAKVRQDYPDFGASCFSLTHPTL